MGQKGQVIVENNFSLRAVFCNKTLHFFTKIYRSCYEGKYQRRKKERRKIFFYNILVNYFEHKKYRIALIFTVFF